MKLVPLYDRVFVEKVPLESVSKGGIIIPDGAKEKPTLGIVVAVGPGVRTDDGKLHPLSLQIGDKVLVGRFAGTEVVVEEQALTVFKEMDILAKVEECV